jgi:hypothetical protein
MYHYRPSTTIGRGLVPDYGAYDGSEYHMPIFMPSAEVLGKREIGELLSQVVIGRYGTPRFAYEPDIINCPSITR